MKQAGKLSPLLI